MKKFLTVVFSTAAIVLGGLSSVHAATIPDEQWNLPMNAPDQEGAELIGLKIANGAAALDSPSYLFGDQNDSGNKDNFLLCSNLADSGCASAASLNYLAYLPPCDSQIIINCITGVSAIATDGKETNGTFVRGFPAKGANDFPGDFNRNLPTGSTPSVWSIPGVTHGGGTDTYVLRFAVQGSAKAGKSFQSNSIKAAIYPMTTQTGNYTTGHMNDAKNPSEACVKDHYRCGFGGEHSGNDVSLSAACVAFETGSCALRQAFPAGYSFKVSALLGDSPTGWFHGRFYDPHIELNGTNGVTKLSIEATPVKVPAVGTFVKQSNMTPEMKTYYEKRPVGGAFGRLSPNGISNLISSPDPSDPNVFEEFSVWSSYFKDKASATQSEWSFRTLELNNGTSSCLRDTKSLVGIVSTNAMIYSGGAPAFNKNEGSLDYKVGSPHYSSNDDVFKGTYDLQVKSSVARCLYNFSSAPIKATISITSETGAENVATTVVSEDKTTGWLRMSAYNFTFSNPTVKVKFSQDAAPGSSKPVVKKLTCVKGKSTKVVITASCPTGYKKK